MKKRKQVELKSRFHEGGINNYIDIFDEQSNFLGNIIVGFTSDQGDGKIELMLHIGEQYAIDRVDMPESIKASIDYLLSMHGLLNND